MKIAATIALTLGLAAGAEAQILDSQSAQTNTLGPGDFIRINVGPGHSRIITGSNFVDSISLFPNWPQGSNSGITAVQGTNIAAYQAQIATQGIGFNFTTNALGYQPATNGNFATGLTTNSFTTNLPPATTNIVIGIVQSFNTATNTYGGITNALSFPPATNSNAGITNALGYVPATNGAAINQTPWNQTINGNLKSLTNAISIVLAPSTNGSALILPDSTGTNFIITAYSSNGTVTASNFISGGAITNNGLYFQTNAVTGAYVYFGTNSHFTWVDEYGTKYTSSTNGAIAVVMTNGNFFSVTNGLGIFSNAVAGIFKTPTNNPTDGFVVTATGTGGDTKYAVSSTGVTNSQVLPGAVQFKIGRAHV